MSVNHVSDGSSTLEHCPMLERDDKSLEKMILRDLFASFRFSQGNGRAHDEFFRGIRVTYEMRLGEAGYGQLQNRLNKLDGIDATRLRVPSNHFDSAGLKDPQPEFNNQLFTFLRMLDGAPVGDPTDIFRRIGAHTIDRDIRYQKAKRWHTPEDAHKSYFRDYILGLEPTGNETFDCLFGLVAATFDSDWLARSGIADFDSLVNGWHDAHPHDSFMAR